jgi:hypothetical protein
MNITHSVERSWIGQTIFFRIFVGFFIQIKGWADEFLADGLFCVWLAQKPVVIIFKPEYVEVRCIVIIVIFIIIVPLLVVGLACVANGQPAAEPLKEGVGAKAEGSPEDSLCRLTVCRRVVQYTGWDILAAERALFSS